MKARHLEGARRISGLSWRRPLFHVISDAIQQPNVGMLKQMVEQGNVQWHVLRTSYATQNGDQPDDIALLVLIHYAYP
jgi:hypothetical protein